MMIPHPSFMSLILLLALSIQLVQGTAPAPKQLRIQTGNTHIKLTKDCTRVGNFHLSLPASHWVLFPSEAVSQQG